ncbi:hypothetical protein [Chitinilyticum litopenaei]|uniref:hypothetical protein n=1 Tax=Chitinilyticum litopenaei TaxID=1121276 RepID=UPI0004172FF4|nr:hypothetical protein [Chitinilyticum litopenaei]
MASTYRLQLGIAMLSPQEAEQVLHALRQLWQSPCWVSKQLHGEQIALLTIRHEAALKPGESPDWFIDRLAAGLWRAIGRYARISVDLAPHEAPDGKLYILDEHHYREILKDFRFSPSTAR